MPERVLITGAQGFVGRYLVAHWLAAFPGATVLGVGRSPRRDDHFTHAVTWGTARVRAPLPPPLRPPTDTARYDYAALDVTQEDAVRALVRDFRPNVVVHLAAALRDDPPEHLFRTNVLGTVALLEAVATADVGAPRLVLGGSGAVYGSAAPEALPLREEAPRVPVDLYGVSKLAAEEATRVVARRHGLAPIGARIFNPLGPGEDERHLGGRLASQVAAIEAGELPPAVAVGPLDTTRDFVDVRDVAQALELLAHRGTPGEVYNVASGTETRCEAILQLFLGRDCLGERVRVERRPGRPADVPRHFADVGRLRALGFRCRHPLAESVADVLQYYRDWVRPAAAAGRAG
jgi:GDP-4-dehydro-6-deoxy-D-mannose reductase